MTYYATASSKKASLTRFKKQQVLLALERLYQASPSVLKIIREMFDSFPYAEKEQDDELVSEFVKAI